MPSTTTRRRVTTTVPVAGNTKSSSKGNKVPPAAIVVPIFLLLVLTAVLYFVRYKRRGAASLKSKIMPSRNYKNIDNVYEESGGAARVTLQRWVGWVLVLGVAVKATGWMEPYSHRQSLPLSSFSSGEEDPEPFGLHGDSSEL